MKMRNLLLFGVLIIVSCFSASAQPQYVEWARAFGGSGHDYAYSIIATDDGGYIIGGSTASTDGDLNGRPVGRSTDAWIVKTDDTGAIEWHKAIGGTGNDYAYAVHPTTDGGYIVGGYTNSENGDVIDKRSGFGFDYWVVKLNGKGDILWSKTLGSSTRDEACDLQVTSDGGFLVIGRTFGKADGDVSFVNSASKYDYWVVKLRSDGSLEWEKTYGGTDTDDPDAIRVTADGGFIMVGSSNSSDGIATTNKGGTDYWVIKADKFGAVEWQKSFGGSGADQARGVVEAKGGGYLVVGSTNSQDGDINAFLHGNYEYWVIKLDDTGRLEWQRILGGSGSDYATSVEAVDDGYLIGGYAQSKDGQVSNGYGTSGNDFWVVKLDWSGDIFWEKSVGGTGNDIAYSVYPTKDGGGVVAGQTQSTDGDVTNSHGGIEILVAKIMPVPVDSVVVNVQGGGQPEITVNGGTLTLEATVYPIGLNQDVVWSIVPVTGSATIDATGVVTAQLNGTVWGKAASVLDQNMADSILITLSGQVIPVDSIVVRTQNGVAPEINTEAGSLQLEATVYPSTVSQDVTWSIVVEDGAASIDANGLVTASANGTLWAKAVSIADGNQMDSLLITITNQGLAVEDWKPESKIIVFPNPTNGQVNIQSDAPDMPVRVIIFDLTGRTVIDQKIESAGEGFSIDLLAPGMYQLYLKGEGFEVRSKLIRK